MKRKTFYGKTIEYKNLSHQHLSNIIWWNRIGANIDVTTDLNHGDFENSANECNELSRFGNILLPYKPLISYREEIKDLEKRGYLVAINDIDYDIVIAGKWVGKVEYK